jgi:tripartite ATP-independent transporter DctM subunit
MPVGFAMLLAGFLGLLVLASPEAALNVLSADIWEQFASYGLSVIPLFVLMGAIVFHAGIADDLFETAYRWIGHRKGGIAAAAVGASAAFAAICGSNAATAATIGTVGLPHLKRYGYHPALSTGAVACGGTLGVVIPPSVVLIVIAIQTEQSVGRLFVASAIPGLLLAGLFLLTIFYFCTRNPELGPAGPRFSFKERLASLPGVIEVLILFVMVIGGLYAGWFTPTEAGAAGSFGALVITLLRGKLTWEAWRKAVLETLRISAMTMMLVTGAVIFGRFLTITRLPYTLCDFAASLPVPPVAILGSVILIYILGGMFMDALGFLVVTIPVFFPLGVALGYDPLWYSVLLNVVTTMGAVTPPVGVCAYIVSGLSPDVSLDTVFRGVLYFIPAYLVGIGLLVLWLHLV